MHRRLLHHPTYVSWCPQEQIRPLFVIDAPELRVSPRVSEKLHGRMHRHIDLGGIWDQRVEFHDLNRSGSTCQG